MSVKAITLRLPEQTYAEALSRKRASLTEFILEAVEEKLAKERENEIRMGLANLAGDLDEDLEPWMDTQRRTMKHLD